MRTSQFEEAGRTGKPRLVFLLADSAGIPSHLSDEDRRTVIGFRGRLRQAGLTVATFTTVDGLELEVFHALQELAGSTLRAVPRQLPAAAAHFAGRVTELGR